MQYLDWNDYITAYFFKPEHAGRRVYLCVTASVIEELGRSAGVGLSDFINAVKTGPPWGTRQGICQRALQAEAEWRLRGLKYPPYIGYLGCFVLAAGLNGDFAAHAYYPRLRTLLDDHSGTGQLPSFERMLELWDDLEQWANQDNQGQFGEFRAEIAGGWINVGLPVAQVILTEQERLKLRTIFAEAGLDPASPPSDQQLISILVSRGGLRPRTAQLLNDNASESSAIRDLLISTVLDELREWDGESFTEEDNRSRIYASLRLGGRIDRVTKAISLSLRVKSSHEIPDEGLVIQLAGYPEDLEAHEFQFGWSDELTSQLNGAPFDPSTINWSAGISGESPGWIFRFPASDVRLFVDGGEVGVSGIIEAPRLQPKSPFYIACSSKAIAEIEKWGNEQCSDFKHTHLQSGLPPGWQLYSSTGAISDAYIRQSYPILSFNRGIRVNFRNGIRSIRNHYFSFGLPIIEVEGWNDRTTLSCNGEPLHQRSDGTFKIPATIASSPRLSIEVFVNENLVTKRTLFVTDDVRITTPSEFRCDGFGQPLSPDTNGLFVSGAISTYEPAPPTMIFVPDSKGFSRHLFIGRVPGQVVSLPAGEYPHDWQPIWLVLMHRRGTVVFCGRDINDSTPLPRGDFEKRQVDEWKDVLLFRRKRITPPKLVVLRHLWTTYQTEAAEL